MNRQKCFALLALTAVLLTAKPSAAQEVRSEQRFSPSQKIEPLKACTMAMVIEDVARQLTAAQATKNTTEILRLEAVLVELRNNEKKQSPKIN